MFVKLAFALVSITLVHGRSYDRCELARELRDQHHVPVEQIGNLVCLAEIASDFDSTAHRHKGHGHVIFQIWDSLWCSTGSDKKGSNIRNIACEKFLNDDDIECARKIEAIKGYHNAWGHLRFGERCDRGRRLFCRSREVFRRSGRDEYEKCELAQELRDKHHVPDEEIGDLVCLAKIASNFQTSAHMHRAHGIFQIWDPLWCSTGSDKKEQNICNVACEKFLDDDISDDIECARKIAAVQGYNNAWGHLKYMDRCDRSQTRQIVDECFADDVHDDLDIRPVGMGSTKQYEQCELAQRSQKFSRRIR